MTHTENSKLKPDQSPRRRRKPSTGRKAKPRRAKHALPETPVVHLVQVQVAMPDIVQQRSLFTDTPSGPVPAGPVLQGPLPGLAEVPFAAALLALGQVKGLGPKGLRAVAGILGEDLGRLLTGSTDFVLSTLLEAKIAGAEKLAEAIVAAQAKLTERGKAELAILQGRGVQVVSPSRLPARLRDVNPDAPAWLFVEGDPGVLDQRPTVAVVGTREPTDKGVRAASVVAKVLAPYPVTLVSGLAEGIDEAAHATSLEQGIRNVAFLGHGVNTVFPAATANLRRSIIRQGGAVVTEYLPDEGIQKRYFVERNRLQAGLADLVIPVEGDPSGGTAHTVRFARSFGRRLVGVRWPEARGLVEEVARGGGLVVDIFTPAGCRQLDRVFQELVEQHQKAAYPLAVAEQNLLKEVRSRSVRPDHLRKLIDNLEKAAKELDDGGQAQGGDLRPHDVPG